MTRISKASLSKRRNIPNEDAFKVACSLILFATAIVGFFVTGDDAHDGSSRQKENQMQIFPHNIGDDEWEVISHPATLFIKTIKKKGETEENESIYSMKMKVPIFWNPVMLSDELKETDIRSYLGNYGQRLMKPDEAASVGSFTEIEGEGFIETIFVSIASYRDFRCPLTVENLFKRAYYPGRIRVSIVDQIIQGEDDACNRPSPYDNASSSCADNPQHAICKYAHLISYYSMDASLSVGPVFARHIGARMYRGEYFAMQTDSHMEFVDGWDVDIIQQWQSTKNEMAILSTYVSGVSNKTMDLQTGTSLTTTRPYMCDSVYEEDDNEGETGHMRHDQQPEGEPIIKGTPMLHPFWAAGFSFARGHFVINVPYDLYLPMIFQGEEANIGIRAFTYGYDFYAPERSVVFHYYDDKRKRKGKKQEKKHLFWENKDTFENVEVLAMRRLKGIIGTNPEIKPDQWNHIEESKYGIGKVRTTTKYFETFGIHPQTNTVEEGLCNFVYMDMHLKFLGALRENKMGLNYNQISFKFKHELYPETIEYDDATDDAAAATDDAI